MNELTSIATWLQATGPYGLVAVLGVAFWKLNEKKDAALRELYEEVTALSRAQTEAVTKVEAALVALKSAIAELRPDTSEGRRANASNR
jgi:hypothetical protein